MNWKTSSYNTQTSGGYAVTKHEMDRVAGTWEYIAWHEHTTLGSFDTADQAKARCLEHAEAK